VCGGGDGYVCVMQDENDTGGHVLYDTPSLGRLCGLV